MRYEVVAIFPSGMMGTVKGGFRRHREAREHMLDRVVELRARYGIRLMVMGERGA